jgi:2-amino-4-hydroxy-6-hydroxymethyldihydropteridine diphosphokinase
MIHSYIAIGSNLANPVQQAQQALMALASVPHCRLLACSRFYRSPPFGPPYNQADYLNAVVALKTTLLPSTLLEALHTIEYQQGRRRTAQRWGPRPLDLDLILYGNEQQQNPQLHLPHPGLTKRPFVLYPLAEIAPDLVLPDGTPLRQLIQQVSDDSLTLY